MNNSTFEPFSYVPDTYLNQNMQSQALAQGSSTSANLDSMNIGAGNNGLYFDQSGLRIGNSDFSTAPFSVSPNGVVTVSSTVSGNTIIIDGSNGRFVGNDGTTNRIVIGNV